VLAAEEVWIEELLQPLLARSVHAPARGRVVVEVQELQKLPPAAQRRVVRAALRRAAGELGRIGFEHIERILGAGAGHLPGGPVHLPGGLRVSRTPSLIVIERAASAGRPRPANAAPDYEYRLAACGTVFIRETGEAVRIAESPAVDLEGPGHDPCTARFDADALEFPVVVRNRRPGDRFRPLGAGGSQKLKKFFGDHKVPADERVRCPLVLSGGNIVWVAGHRVDERARLRPDTRRVLTAERFIAPFGAESIALPGAGLVAPPEASD